MACPTRRSVEGGTWTPSRQIEEGSWAPSRQIKDNGVASSSWVEDSGPWKAAAGLPPGLRTVARLPPDRSRMTAWSPMGGLGMAERGRPWRGSLWMC